MANRIPIFVDGIPRFYTCDCPRSPASDYYEGIEEWMDHLVNCPTRKVHDIHLPLYPIEELA